MTKTYQPPSNPTVLSALWSLLTLCSSLLFARALIKNPAIDSGETKLAFSLREGGGGGGGMAALDYGPQRSSKETELGTNAYILSLSAEQINGCGTQVLCRVVCLRGAKNLITFFFPSLIEAEMKETKIQIFQQWEDAALTNTTFIYYLKW